MHKIFLRIAALEVYNQIYLIAFIPFILATVHTFFWPSGNTVQASLFLLAWIGFGCGFLVWFIPITKRCWAHPGGKVVISVAHVFVLLLAAVFARNLVSSALGLPAQDFELTVSFLTLLFYVPAFAIAASLTIAVAAFLGFSAIFFPFLGSLTWRLKWLAHAIGAFVIVYAVGEFSGMFMKNNAIFSPMARRIAFYSDYQPASNYPAVNHANRIRIHTNRVISNAMLTKDDVIITVSRMEQ